MQLSGSFFAKQGGALFTDIELSLFPNGWTCLLGPSGVGKTTILRLIAGLPTHGDFSGAITPTLKKGASCAYMAQQDLLLPWLDVLGNVMMGAKLRGETADRNLAQDLIRRVGLAEHADKKPAQLSGGMRQRAALARTLMEDRALVLLDEPFSALDARTRAEMQELAHELLHGKTVLLVTHDPAEAARIGDRNYILNEDVLFETAAKPGTDIAEPDVDETLVLQSQLLTRLRKRAA